MGVARTAGASIIAGMQDALAYAEGETERGKTHIISVPATVDVKESRQRDCFAQADFAR